MKVLTPFDSDSCHCSGGEFSKTFLRACPVAGVVLGRRGMSVNKAGAVFEELTF